MRVVITILFVLAGSFLFAGSNDQKPAILVTGASSGLGRALAEKLAESNYYVFAGVRKKDDINALPKSEHIEGVLLDVTKQEDIDKAVAFIEKEPHPLLAIVNNAGAATFGSLTEMEVSEFKLVFDVNVFGPYRITKVILIEPGSFKSKMGETVMDGLKKKGSIEDNPTNTEITSAKEPDEIIATIIKAIESQNPGLRYMVPSDANEAEFTTRSVANKLAQINQGHKYSLSEDELTKMLEQEMHIKSP